MNRKKRLYAAYFHIAGRIEFVADSMHLAYDHARHMESDPSSRVGALISRVKFVGWI